MSIKIFSTRSKARLQLVKQSTGKFNWVFIPGGPVLGSESLQALTDFLNLPGSIWHFDFPGDGSNLVEDHVCYNHWFDAIREVTQELDNVILVGHSTGGMLILATSDLETHLSGLVLMDSAPSAIWLEQFGAYAAAHPIPNVDKLSAQYDASPSNDLLKEITLLSIPYVATNNSLAITEQIFKSLPINCKAQLWAANNFDSTYTAQWIPQNILVLIFAGAEDKITPVSLFRNDPMFNRKNIVLKEIADAAHFPWLDNKEQVELLFNEYQLLLS